jgi:Fe2+ or Zn2+ uptake regulation protein
MEQTDKSKIEMVVKIRQYCKENGLLLTDARLLVAVKLYELGRYENARSLWSKLKKESHFISLSAVYLGLEFLKEAGVVHVKQTTSRRLKYKISMSIKPSVYQQGTSN